MRHPLVQQHVMRFAVVQGFQSSGPLYPNPAARSNPLLLQQAERGPAARSNQLLLQAEGRVVPVAKQQLGRKQAPFSAAVPRTALVAACISVDLAALGSSR